MAGVTTDTASCPLYVEMRSGNAYVSRAQNVQTKKNGSIFVLSAFRIEMKCLKFRQFYLGEFRLKLKDEKLMHQQLKNQTLSSSMATDHRLKIRRQGWKCFYFMFYTMEMILGSSTATLCGHPGVFMRSQTRLSEKSLAPEVTLEIVSG